MKLNGHQIIVFDHCGKREAVVANGCGVWLANGRRIGMGEIEKSILSDSFEQSTRSQPAALIPADMRGFHVFRQSFHSLVNEIEAQFSGSFFAGCEQRL